MVVAEKLQAPEQVRVEAASSVKALAVKLPLVTLQAQDASDTAPEACTVGLEAKIADEETQLKSPSVKLNVEETVSVAEAASASSESVAVPAVAPRVLAVAATVSAVPDTVRLDAPASTPAQDSGTVRVAAGGSHSVAPEAMVTEASIEVPALRDLLA
jgi:hypothetical protein